MGLYVFFVCVFFVCGARVLWAFLGSAVVELLCVEIILACCWKKNFLSNLKESNGFLFPFVAPHPYLPFTYRPGTLIPMPSPREYDFMGYGCSFPKLKTNTRGHLNGAIGNREVQIPKPRECFRISCLGDSVMANYVQQNGVNYNFSVEIERQLHQKTMNREIEVNNCAIGGYTTLDILVKFLIKDIHEEPDLIIISHGYSNLRSYLTGTYQSDNSHFRKGFWEGETRYQVARYIPFKYLNIYRFVCSPFFPEGIKDFLKYISIGVFDVDKKWQGIEYFEKNMKNLCSIAEKNNIKILICTCPHYLHQGIQSSKAHAKFHEGMQLQNQVLREIAKKTKSILVDNESLVEGCAENFIDSIHLSPVGMQKSAGNVVDAILHNKLHTSSNV